MTILFAHKTKDASRWIEAFKEYKDLDFEIYPEIADPAKIEFVASFRMPPGLVKQLPNLKCIASIGAGVDGLMWDKDIPSNVKITKIVDDYLANQLVHYCLLAVLTQLRKWEQFLDPEYSKQWKRYSPPNTKLKKIGILGLGSIGSKIAKGFKDLDFDVRGLATRKHQYDFKCYTYEEMDEFLDDLDFIISVLPLTDKTRGILSKDLFNKLKKPAYLINVGRGDHLVEDDLIQAIEDEKLSGACLDVFNKEPLDPNHKFWSHPKIIVTPHIAALSDPKFLVPQIVENYYRLKNNEELKNVVDRNKEY